MLEQAVFGKDDFVLWAPNVVEIEEVRKGNKDLRLIGGYCSTESLDRQGEIVLQNGLDFNEFVNFGYYNDNHKSDTAAVVGIPHLARFESPRGWFTKGELLNTVRANQIWELAKSLSGTRRRLGFSIEGKVMERRQGFKIAKAKVRHVAITNSPVNTDCTWDILGKSFCSNPSVPEAECNCCVESAAKALQVGQDIVPDEGGRVLVPQDLERGEIKRLYVCPRPVAAESSLTVLPSMGTWTKTTNPRNP